MGAKYCRSNKDITVIDWDKNDVLNYLGTYFPRSYAEAYCIFTEFFKKNPEYTFKTNLNVFDLGCGTGGEIIGLIDCISKQIPEIQEITFTAMDGNEHALRLLERIFTSYKDKSNIELRINPLHWIIDDLTDLDILEKALTGQFDLIMSFKAICEFVTKETFQRDNAYGHVINTFIHRLKNDGTMLLADVTSYNNVSKEWLPKMMDVGIMECNDCLVLLKNEGYNQSFFVTHSISRNDRSKIAWRVLGREDFVREISGYSCNKAYHKWLSNRGILEPIELEFNTIRTIDYKTRF